MYELFSRIKLIRWLSGQTARSLVGSRLGATGFGQTAQDLNGAFADVFHNGTVGTDMEPNLPFEAFFMLARLASRMHTLVLTRRGVFRNGIDAEPGSSRIADARNKSDRELRGV